MRSLGLLIAAAVMTAVAGCAEPVVGLSPTLPEKTADAVDRVLASVPGQIPPQATILVATPADLTGTDIRRSSNFGRLVSEEIAQRLVQLGYRVPEVRLAGTMLLRDTGEFALSRRTQDVRRHQDAQFIVTGTYTPMGDQTYVNLKLVRLVDGLPIGAADFQTRRLVRLY
jgi:TolB-like protein